MALAWIMAADLLEREKPREAYGTDGRLAFDIEASLTGEAPVAVAAASKLVPAAKPNPDLSGCAIPEIARLYESLRGVYDHLAAASQKPCFSDDDGRGDLKPAGAILG